MARARFDGVDPFPGSGDGYESYPERYVISPPPVRTNWWRNAAVVAAIVVAVAMLVLVFVLPGESAAPVVSRQLVGVSTATAPGPVPCVVPAGGEYPR